MTATTSAAAQPATMPAKRGIITDTDAIGDVGGKKQQVMAPVMRVKLLSPDAKVPVRGSALAAGYDLFSSADTLIPAHGKAIVPTDIAIAVPLGTYGRIAPRSGLAAKHHLDLGAGVVDADYRGPVGVVMFNHSPTAAYQVRKGDRVAQLVLEKICMADVEQVGADEDLDGTARGAGGFGSTGAN